MVDWIIEPFAKDHDRATFFCGQVPVVLLARLAVDQSAQGHRLGEGLLLDALQRSPALSSTLGVHAVEVEALDDVAAAFYRNYGFTPLIDAPLHLYLPLATVEDALS